MPMLLQYAKSAREIIREREV